MALTSPMGSLSSAHCSVVMFLSESTESSQLSSRLHRVSVENRYMVMKELRSSGFLPIDRARSCIKSLVDIYIINQV